MSRERQDRVRVWDLPVRILHWVLVASVTGALVTGFWSWPRHEAFGYVVGAIVIARTIWGFTGGFFARFRQFLVPPGAVIGYAKLVLRHREPRHVGHNPLGAWMIVLLLADAAAVSLTGFLYTTEWLWGYAWLEALHRWLAWSLVGLIFLHLCGVVFTSIRHRENLVLAMFTGQKAASGNEASPHTGPSQ